MDNKLKKAMDKVYPVVKNTHTSVIQRNEDDRIAFAKGYIAATNESMKQALEVYEAAFDNLFTQCLSNPVYNAWGKQIDLSLLNKAHMLAGNALKGE